MLSINQVHFLLALGVGFLNAVDQCILLSVTLALPVLLVCVPSTIKHSKCKPGAVTCSVMALDYSLLVG